MIFYCKICINFAVPVLLNKLYSIIQMYVAACKYNYYTNIYNVGILCNYMGAHTFIDTTLLQWRTGKQELMMKQCNALIIVEKK